MKFVMLLFCSSVYADNQVYIDQIGSYNNVSIEQISSTSASTYTDLHMNGNYNTAIIHQESIVGTKNISLSLSGNNKTVDIIQQGSGNHQASILLSGEKSGLNLIQNGNISQSYSLNFTCTTPGGCATIQVQLGQ